MSTQSPSETDGSAARIEHRPHQHRFVLSRDDEDLSHLEYVPKDGVWSFTHTWTEPGERHHGYAAKVVAAAFDGARDAAVTVRPVCPYVRAFLDRHPEYQHLLVPQSSR